MKKDAARLTAITLSLILGVTGLSACGNSADKEGNSGSSSAASSASSSEEASKSESKSESTSQSEAQNSGDRITISVLGIDWGSGPIQNSTMEQFWEDYFDVDLDVEWVNWEDYDQKLNTMIAAGSFPDVVQINGDTSATYYYPIFTQAIDSGLFLDMKPYLFDGGNGVAEKNSVMKEWSDDFWQQAEYEDGIYILPRSKSESGMFSGVSVRKDLMDKYGFTDEPATMDELKDWLIDFSKAATEGEGHKVYGLEYTNTNSNFMYSTAKAFATAFTGQTDWQIDADGNFEYIQFNDKYIDFLDWMKDLYDAGAIDPEFALGNADTSRWKGGNSVAVMQQWYNWNQSADLTSNKVFDKSTPDTLAAWCLKPIEGPEAYAISPNYSDIDRAIAINAKCSEEKIQKIMEVFNATDETHENYISILLNGVEGVDYKLQDDGTLDTTSDPDFEVKRREGYVGGWNQIFLKTDADQITDKFMRAGTRRASDENIERAEEIKKVVYDELDKSGIKNEAQNLQSDTYNKQWGVLTDDVGAMCTQYIMGQLSADQWKEFVKGIKESPDYQAVISEFKEAKEASN